VLKIIDNRASSGSKEPGEAFGIFTVLEDQPEEEGDFALYVKSVIVFGRISIVEDRDKVLKSAMSLADHIYPEQKEFYNGDLERNKNTVQILEITPEHITGKKVHEQ